MADLYDQLVGPFQSQLETIMDAYGIVGGLNRNGVAHVLGSALIGYDYGIAVADIAGWAKEVAQTLARGNDYADFKVDVYNNQLGAKLALEAQINNLTRDQLIETVIEPHRAGRIANVRTNVPSLIGSMFGVKCFPPAALISLSFGQTKAISSIRIGDTTLAFDPSRKNAIEALVPCRVTRLFHNVTESWIRVHFPDFPGQAEITATPGHHMAKPGGGFAALEGAVRRTKKVSESRLPQH